MTLKPGLYTATMIERRPPIASDSDPDLCSTYYHDINRTLCQLTLRSVFTRLFPYFAF